MIRSAIYLQLIFASLLLVPRVVLAAKNSDPAVYFEEIMWDGSDRSSSDEWFELKSTVDKTLTLDDWKVIGAGPKEIDLSGYQLPAFGSLLVSHADQRHKFSKGESALAVDPDIVQSSLSLSNSKFQLTLMHGQDVVDQVGNGGKPPVAATDPISSMERQPPLKDDIWLVATSASHMDSDSAVLANPNHAGRPKIIAPALVLLPSGKPGPIELQVQDSDGEDSIDHVGLVCGQNQYEFVDTGLAGDRIAGDRMFTALVRAGNLVNQTCLATVIDQRQLFFEQNILVQTFVPDAAISVNEVYPMPNEGEEEFIELANAGNEAVRLDGWMIDDEVGGGSKPYTLNGCVVPAHGFVALPKSKTSIALNDDGDHVVLTAPSGLIKSDIAYGRAKRGQSWSVQNTVWSFALPTPGEENAGLILAVQSDVPAHQVTDGLIITPKVAAAKPEVSTRIVVNPQAILPFVTNVAEMFARLAQLKTTALIVDVSGAIKSLRIQVAIFELKRWIRFSKYGIVSLLSLLAAVISITEARRSRLLLTTAHFERIL